MRTVFSLAMEDVAGFDSYARQVGRLFRDDSDILEDVLDCLFFVAMADGVLHPNELELLRKAADRFGTSKSSWRRVKAAHLGADKEDPYAILGLDHEVSDDDLRATYRALAKTHHPDALIARGVPEDLIKIAEHRMAVINEAYETAMAERGAA